MLVEGKIPTPGSNIESAKVKIGKLDPNRWEQYRDLRYKGLQEEPIAFEDPLKGKARLDNLQEGEWKAMLEGRVSADGHTQRIILCADENGELVGTVDVEVSHITGDTIATIQNFYTVQAARGRGLGKKLIDAVLVELNQISDLKTIELHVYRTQEKAMEMYKSLGFEIVEEVKDAKEYNGQKIDRIHMRKLPEKASLK